MCQPPLPSRHPYQDVIVKVQSGGISSGIHSELGFSPLKIRAGGRVTPEALTHSIDVIHSCRPGCFFPLAGALRSYRAKDALVDPIEKPVSSTLKIAEGGYLF
jgi:hypothetical protein